MKRKQIVSTLDGCLATENTMNKAEDRDSSSHNTLGNTVSNHTCLSFPIIVL